MQKVLVIGLDGATFDLIDPWIREGHLPTMARLLRDGVHAPLISTPQYNSAQAWSTFITGKNPGKHGINDFTQSRPHSYEMRFINAASRDGKSLWRILSDAGKNVVVMNVPITYPPEPVNGCLIPGLDAPGIKDEFCYPQGLLQEIESKVGPYPFEVGVAGLVRSGRPDVAISNAVEAIEGREKTSLYLMKTHPWDFFMVVFTEPDRLQHHFWKYHDPEHPAYHSPERQQYGDGLLRVYSRIDQAIASLLEQAGEDTTAVLMSDHGAGTVGRKLFFINRWLEANGFLTFEKQASPRAMTRSLLSRLMRRGMKFLNAKTSRRTKEALTRTVPGLREKVASAVTVAGINWANTKAFSRERAPTIWINRKDRFPQGCVDPGAEYERVRDAVTDGLLKLRCPESGEPIVTRVYKREELYHGKHSDQAADLTIVFNKYTERPSQSLARVASADSAFVHILSPEQLARAAAAGKPNGNHRREGIFIASGAGVRRGVHMPGTDLVNLTSTILYALGQPIPSDMDGEVIEGMFTEEYVAAHPLIRGKEAEETVAASEEDGDYSEEEAAIIRERLRGLGYVD
jgi:predicted AlkP superfamily phosphohydrolase/phosphomutase